MSYVPNTLELKILKVIARGGGTPVSHGTIHNALEGPMKAHLNCALSIMIRQKIVEASYQRTADGKESHTGYRLTPKGEALPGVVTP